MSLIEIHTHILPGLDDGASSLEVSLQMAQVAADQGISKIIATPHHANGHHNNFAEEVLEATERLNEQLIASGIPLMVVAGQEIRVHDDLLDSWGRQELLSLAHSRYILLELPSSNVPDYMDDLLHELGVLNLTPVIAHPERNAELMREPDILQNWVENGVIAQVTAQSLLGGAGKKMQQAAWSMTESGLIHIVASDAHNVERRGFHLQQAYAQIDNKLGSQWKQAMIANAESVWHNESIAALPLARKRGNVFKKLGGIFKRS